MLEIQQAVDLTYRLFDYGRPRELHLEESRDVVRARPHAHRLDTKVGDQSVLLVAGPLHQARLQTHDQSFYQHGRPDGRAGSGTVWGFHRTALDRLVT